MKTAVKIQAALAFAFCAAVADAATYTWTGGGDNATFTDMQNWGQAEGTAFDTAGSYTFPDTTTASAIAFPEGSTQVYGTITFNSGCPAITFSGGKITKVVKVVSNSSNNMTFNNAVTFNGNIDVNQTVALWNANNAQSWTPPNGRVIFWGGATGSSWTRYNNNKNIVSGHYILTTSTDFDAASGNADRTIIAPNSSLTVKVSDQTQELYLMPGSSFIVTTTASHGWGNSDGSHRLWCWNNGGNFIASNGYTLTNSGKQWLGGYRDNATSCTLNKNWKIFAKSIKVTKTGGIICLHSWSNKSGTDYSDIYVGSGGMACTGTACMQVENSGHPTTIHPIDSNFTIARGGNTTGDLQLGNATSSGATQLTLATDDTNGVPRTVTLAGLLSSTTTTAKFIVSGHGTNSVTSASGSMTGTYTVSSGATAVFAANAGFASATVSVANGGRLVAGGGAAKAGKLKVADGATLEFKLGEASCTSFAATSVTPAASGAAATVRFSPGSVKTVGHSYTLVTGANLSSTAAFTLPEDDKGSLSVVGGNLVYTVPPYFYIKMAESSQEVAVPLAWAVEKGVVAEGVDVETGTSALAGDGANGIPAWQSWCLGLAPNDASSVVLCEAAETQPGGGTFAIAAKNVDVKASGAVVTAYLDKSPDGTSWTQVGAGQEVSSGPVSFDASLADGESRCFFRIRVAVR